MKCKKLSLLLIVLPTLLLASCNVKASEPKEEIKPEASSMFKKANVDKIKVISQSCNIYDGNTRDHNILYSADKDSIIDVYGYSKDWYIVETSDGRLGAVSPEDVKPYIEEINPSDANANIKKLTPNEEEIARLLNGERIKRGLSPLKIDMTLTKLARDKSSDIIINDYFSHYSPTYGSPFDMLDSYQIKYIYAGENLAGNTDIAKAHKQLMDSDEHRKNILNKNYTHIGIGVKEGSKYGKIITEIFVGR